MAPDPEAPRGQPTQDWRGTSPEAPRAQQPDSAPYRMHAGGASRQLRVPGDTHQCPECDKAKADPENHRNHCAAHDHVMRTEAP